ncbi:MAG: 23S rRNA (uracil(1939)-C(5))-methyltransferase RlmD [Clostridia bacterium]|nr:23S rRNA (uracil(1939)-C(5))-methyltransferase RlmD [Clostridia bacterium]
MLNKNQEKIGIVTALSAEGDGIVKDEDKVVFVPFSIVGEKIKYRILKVTSKCAYGKLLEVIIPSSERAVPECKYFSKCGGCQLQHITYQKQLEIKRESIKNAFSKIAFLEVKPENVIIGENKFRYRNKISLPISQQGDKLNIGFYAENSHRVIDIDDCLINPEWTSVLIKCTREYMQKYSLKGYDEFTNKGDVREITAREVSGNLIITLVSLSKMVKGINDFVDILKQKLNKEFTLFLNYNPKNTNKIYGEEFFLIYGKAEQYGEMLGIKFPMGAQSFMQVNFSVCEKLYSKVNELVGNSENNVVIDGYSGAGLMTALLAKTAKKVYGIEIIPQAVEHANALAKENGLSEKIINYVGKCESIMPDIITKEKQKKSEITLVLDPPRKGCELSLIDAIIESDIDKIVYVSCKPTTLARDIGLLVGTLDRVDGQVKKSENPTCRYEIESVTPFEMFPETKHIETVVCLKKLCNDLYIRR